VVEVDVDGVCAVDMEEVVERLGRREDLDMPPCLGCDTDLLLAGNALLFWHLLVHYVALSVHDRFALVHNLSPVLGHIDRVAFQLRHLLALLSLPSLKAGSLTLLQREKCW